MKQTRYIYITLIAFSLILSACSSGGGGGGSGGGTDATTVTGTASKGIIINGVVKAFKIVNGHIDTTPLATGTTDATGKYSLEISDYSGPLFITVSPDTSSTMKCDAAGGCGSVPFGGTMPMPSDMTMEAVLPEVTTGTVEGHVTPLSHMAAAMSKDTFLDESNIQTAIDKLEALFDISDLLNTDPVDVTDDDAVASANSALDDDALKIGFLSAAIEQLAQTDGGGDISSTLNTLADNFASNHGELVYNTDDDDAGATDGTTITLAEITSEMLDAVSNYETLSGELLNDALLENEITALNSTASDSANTDLTTTTEVTVTDTELSEAISKAKGVVSTLRTWSTQLTALEEAGELFGDEIDMASTASELAAETVGIGLEHASQAAVDAYWWSKFSANALIQNLAGKTLTVNEEGETSTLAFDCEGEYQEDSILTGDYFAEGNVLYLYEDDSSSNVSFPSSSPSEGTSISYEYYSYIEDSSYSGSATITAIVDNTEGAGCDLSVATDLNEYFSEEPEVNASGTINVTGMTVTIDGTIEELGFDSSAVDLSYSMPAITASNFTAGVSGTVVVADKATLTIANDSEATINFPSSVIVADDVNDWPAPTNASLSLNATLAQGSLDDDGAAVADPISFQGQLNLSLIKSSGDFLDEDLEVNPVSMTLDGIFSSLSGKSVDAELNVTMANATTFVPQDLEGTSKVIGSYSFSDGGNVLTLALPEESITYTYNTGDSSVILANNEGTVWIYSGPYTSLDHFFSIFTPWGWTTEVEYEGEYFVAPPESFSPSGGQLTGELIEQESEGETMSNWRQLSAILEMSAELDSLPEATLSVDIERTGYAAASATVIISYDDISISVSGSGDDTTDTLSASVVVSDVSDSENIVKLTITPDTEADQFKGSVKVGSHVVGSMNEGLTDDVLIVTYVDGSFESVTF